MGKLGVSVLKRVKNYGESAYPIPPTNSYAVTHATSGRTIFKRSPVTLAEESVVKGVADVRGPNRVATPQDEEASTYSPNVEPCWEDTPFEAAQS